MTMGRIPARVASPGKIILREIEARGWTQKDLADIIRRPVQAVNEIIKGTKQVTPETALELGAAFGTSPQLWLNLESNYRLWLAAKKKDALEIQKRGRLYDLLPVRELQRRGWLKQTDSTDELEEAACEFLCTDSLGDYVPMVANFRCSLEKEPDVPSKLAWLKRAEALARAKQVRNYDREALLGSISDLLFLSEDEEKLSLVPGRLADLGVKFVVVPHLPRTYVDGAAFFCDGSPIIALSLRYDRLDAFWFNLCHELSHILHGGGESYLCVNVQDVQDDTEESSCFEEERRANNQAEEWLIDPGANAAFLQSIEKPFVSRKTIEEFARSLHRHPAIVLGRLQQEGHVPYKNLRGMLGKASPNMEGFIDR